MEKSNDVLLIRHLPSCLSADEKNDLLRHFGATGVKVMGVKGSMKHTAFASFANKTDAAKAMKRLHQLEILGCQLIVEYARTSQNKNFPCGLDNIKHTSKPQKESKPSKDVTDLADNQPSIPKDEVYKKWSLDFPRHPSLHYLYPPPTVSTITNIANTLAAYPKFYVQVLHLMNKMNLPPPFGAVTARPPIPEDKGVDLKTGDTTQIRPKEPSSEESEIEGSDGEEIYNQEKTNKRRMKRDFKLPSKRPKVVLIPKSEDLPIRPINPGAVYTPKEVFEQPTNVTAKKIQMKLPESVAMAPEPTEMSLYDLPEPPKDTESTESTAGFGKIQPVEKPKSEEIMTESELPYKINPEDFLTKQELKARRISQSEMKHFNVFKNYKEGEPTSRLYVKNLAKQATEQDLMNIYGSYVDWSRPDAQNVFDIRLMKEGRMKGQAFVTFPSEAQAIQALSDTNGFVLHSKPMAVQYARSAKAKETSAVK